MTDKTKIEWTDATWNPIAGCSVVSPGCTNCYAMKMAARLEAMGSPIYRGLTQRSKAGAVWTGKVGLSNWGQVIKPLSWKKPRRIFVNSMSDLFHESIPDEWIDQVFAIMANSRRHAYQVLTKRAGRMRAYMSGLAKSFGRLESASRKIGYTLKFEGLPLVPWPLSNVWLGVSVENQASADQRIPPLLETPAAIRFISAEPLLGPVTLTDVRVNRERGGGEFSIDALRVESHCFVKDHLSERRLDWVIVGGESGPAAREFMLSWAKNIVEQCRSSGVACFVKQLGANAWDDLSYVGSTPHFKTRDRKGGDWSEWPKVLRIRELPHA